MDNMMSGKSASINKRKKGNIMQKQMMMQQPRMGGQQMIPGGYNT